MSFHDQKAARTDLDGRTFDVAVIGGGINGVCLYHHLCEGGYSVLLLDKADFAGGTTQASAMMIWGGLLYLRSFDLVTVWKLSQARERMLHDLCKWVEPCTFRYLPVRRGAGWRMMVHTALYLYWLMGRCRREKPSSRSIFPESSLLTQQHRHALTYEEAHLRSSDARFALHWLFGYQNDHCRTVNYCPVMGCAFDSSDHMWRLNLRDHVLDRDQWVRARWVVNTAGVWTDTVNAQFGIQSPYKHVLSKGVFVGLPRDPRHEVPLLFDTQDGKDGMSLIPWGPVSLWGPTETIVETPEEGFGVEPGDIRWLLSELNQHLKKEATAADIVSLRCGVRPLAVHRSYRGNGHSIQLSRRHRVHRDRELPWISVYGSKITNCVPLAEHVTRMVEEALTARRAKPHATLPRTVDIETIPFPGLDDQIPSPSWCAEREMCWTLEDYLRRRTNVSQWVPRGGLGARGEHRDKLVRLGAAFVDGEGNSAEDLVQAYERKIASRFDRVLAEC